uniref:Uncharacterized protein n=1 Tax=Acrobeloides nanus TaxID=290746 RepID=A0A914EJX6_9BILA
MLKAIIFCYPALQGLSEEAQQLLREQQEKYAIILLRHLQARHGNEEGAKKYNDVIALIQTFFYFTECHKQIHIIPGLEMEQMTPPYYEGLPPTYIKGLPPIFEKILIS